MSLLRNFSKFITLTALVYSVGVVDLTQHRTSNNALIGATTGFENLFKQVNADILTGDAPLNSSQVPLIRFMYMLINGPGNGGYPSGFSGPSTGLLGMIREITGPTALGGGLTTAGYSTCTSIPSTGNATMTESGGAQFKMFFETPVKTIPTGYTGGGSTFDKRVVVQYRASSLGSYATFFNIEFQCATNVGWLRFFENGQPQATARNIEVNWDTETSTAVKMELNMYYEAGLATSTGNEYFSAKFETAASNAFKFWITRSVDKTGTTNDQGMRAAANGNSSTKLVNGYLKFGTNITDTSTDYTDIGTIFTGDVQCLDLTTAGTPTLGTGCSALDASAGAPIIDSGDGFSVAWAADTANGMKNDMTAIADPTNP